MSQLFDLLVAVYGVLNRNICCDATGTRSFRIDDQHAGDINHGFCQISVRCNKGDGLSIELFSCPLNDAVREFIEVHDGSIHETPNGSVVTWPVPVRRGPQLIKELALLIRRIVGRGRTYADPNLKWQCPRAADTLGKLADAMGSNERRHRRQPVSN